MPQIFFHVGLGKTGTTYLQYRVFPHFEGVKYIQRTKYKRAKKIIRKGRAERYFISREFDQQLEQEVADFSADFPDTKSIIVFRRQDSWIASQYRRFVKNGFTGSFTEFIDLENDQGRFKKEDLDFYHKLEVLEKYFSHKPLVLFYDDMRENPFLFFDKIAGYMGARYDRRKIDLEKKHTSYSEKQLKAIRQFSKYFDITKRHLKNRTLHTLRMLYVNAVRYIVLYTALLLPKSMFDDEALIPPSDLEKIRNYTADNWEKVHAYAERNNTAIVLTE